MGQRRAVLMECDGCGLELPSAHLAEVDGKGRLAAELLCPRCVMAWASSPRHVDVMAMAAERAARRRPVLVD